jgi:hypothetical protein
MFRGRIVETNETVEMYTPIPHMLCDGRTYLCTKLEIVLTKPLGLLPTNMFFTLEYEDKKITVYLADLTTRDKLIEK